MHRERDGDEEEEEEGENIFLSDFFKLMIAFPSWSVSRFDRNVESTTHILRSDFVS